MPFEIAPKEVSVADKLAALIEAGRAAHPEKEHVRKAWATQEGVCAMSFAYLAAGIDPSMGGEGKYALARAIGCEADELGPLMRAVVSRNDSTTSTIPEIVTALRSGELKPDDGGVYFVDCDPPEYGWIKTYAQVMAKQQNGMIKLVTSFYGDKLKFDPVVFAPKVMETVELPFKAPAKKIRQNAKTGKCWPVAKHAYA